MDEGYRVAVYIDEDAVSSELLQATLEQIVRSPREWSNRCLIRIRSEATLGRLGTSPLLDYGIHLLLHHGLSLTRAGQPGTVAFPPEATTRDIEDYGLAFSDAVAVDGRETNSLEGRARLLGKRIVSLEEVLGPIGLAVGHVSLSASRTLERFRRLDPDAGMTLSHALRHAGRLNIVLSESIAFLGKALRWRFGRRSGYRSAFGHLVDASKGLRPRLWTPTDWNRLPPPGSMFEHLPMAQAFGWMDRAASVGAGIYRDLIWLVHGGTFLAVFAAVADVVWRRRELPISDHQASLTIWPCIELVSLTTILLLVTGMYWVRLQHLWTACRIGAEQLRLARMSLPLLIVPPVLLTADIEGGGADLVLSRSGKGVEEAAVSIALVKRAVRSCGPIGPGQITSIVEAAQRLRTIVKAQHDYHINNHDKLEAIEVFVRSINGLVFALVIAVVISHIVHPSYPHLHWLDPWWSLLVTASGPAFAGALHGATARLEVARRGDLSRTYAQSLEWLEDELGKIVAFPQGRDWGALRALALRATEAMGGEAGAWHATMLVEPVTLPS